MFELPVFVVALVAEPAPALTQTLKTQTTFAAEDLAELARELIRPVQTRTTLRCLSFYTYLTPHRLRF